MQPENVLVKRIRAAIHDRYPTAWSMKVHGGPYQDAGVPDVLVVIDGHLFALEVKRQRPGESEQHARDRESPRQFAVRAQLTAAGATAAVVLSVEEVLAILGARFPTAPNP